MKKLYIYMILSIMSIHHSTEPKDKSKKSWTFERDKYLDKPNQNIEMLILATDVLNQVKMADAGENKKNGVIKKAEKDIVRLKRIQQNLEKLSQTAEIDENESQKEIIRYKKEKLSLIKSAQKDIQILINIEHKLIKLEEDTQKDHTQEKLKHRKHKTKLIEEVKTTIEDLLTIERKLLEITKKYPKEHSEAETIYYETEYLKGPEIHDRETMSIEDSQYHDHLHKGISKYSSNYHDKIRKYHWSNT